MDLLSNEKRTIVFEMLELYFKRAETIEDFDTLGYLSLKAEHRQLYLKCAEAAYSCVHIVRAPVGRPHDKFVV